MKRFLRPSTQDFPEGFGQIMESSEAQGMTDVHSIRDDFKRNIGSIISHGTVLYERPQEEDVPKIECTKWINDQLRGVLFHDGIKGHGPVHGISLFAVQPSATATLCADIDDIAKATRAVLQDRQNSDVIKHKGSRLSRLQRSMMPTLFRDMSFALRKGDSTEKRKALLELRTVLMSLSDPGPHSLSPERVYRLARDIQLEIGDKLTPIDWKTYWLAHMHDGVMHARDIRTQIRREHNQTFGYCYQRN